MRVKTDNENVWVDLVKIFCAFVVAAGHCLFSSSVLLSWLPDAVACAVQIQRILRSENRCAEGAR